MTREDLKKKQATLAKRAPWLVLIPFGIAALALMAHAYMRPQIDRLSPMAQTVVFMGALLSFVIAIPLVLLLITRMQRRHGLMCPECRKPMIGTTGMIIMATGRCGHCGHRILTDAD